MFSAIQKFRIDSRISIIVNFLGVESMEKSSKKRSNIWNWVKKYTNPNKANILGQLPASSKRGRNSKKYKIS